jgi:uncharacterized protein
MPSLLFNVSGLLKEGVGATREYDVDDDVPVEGGSRQVSGHVTMLRTQPGVLVTADLRGVEREQCSRCLRDIEVPLEISFAEEFFASTEPRTGAALPPPEDAEAFRIDGEQMLSLDEAVRQYWTATAPIQPLCRPDCLGLCPRCGKDLNEGPCGCKQDVDERWAALSELSSELKGK